MQWIDHHVLAQLGHDVGEALLPHLISLFVEDSAMSLADMQRATDRQDAEALLLLAHTLKSVCATYGAQVSQQQAKALEAACRQQNWHDIGIYLDALQRSVPESSQALQDYLLQT